MNIQTFMICCRSYFPSCKFEYEYDAVTVTFKSSKPCVVPLTISCDSDWIIFSNWTNDLFPITYNIDSLIDRLKSLKCSGWKSA